MYPLTARVSQLDMENGMLNWGVMRNPWHRPSAERKNWVSVMLKSERFNSRSVKGQPNGKSVGAQRFLPKGPRWVPWWGNLPDAVI